MKKSKSLNTNYKKAFSLVELTIVLFISSIIFIYTFSFSKNLYEIESISQKNAILKIDLNSTKIILEKNLSNLSKTLKYDGSYLYLSNNILLKNVTEFKIRHQRNSLHIDITVEDKISQEWIFNL